MNIKTLAFKKIITKDYTFFSFWISLIGFGLSFYFGKEILAVLSSIILFSSFDSFGYYYATTHYQKSEQTDEYFENLAGYRNIQFGFQLLLSLLLGIISIKCLAAFIALWWFGVADAIYYLLLKQNFLQYTNIDWLSWTIWGSFTKNVTGKKLLFWSILSSTIIFGGMIYLWLK